MNHKVIGEHLDHHIECIDAVVEANDDTESSLRFLRLLHSLLQERINSLARQLEEEKV